MKLDQIEAPLLAVASGHLQLASDEDSTVGLAKPLGVRGAVMADTVGAGVPRFGPGLQS
jgi:hypothetical protein